MIFTLFSFYNAAVLGFDFIDFDVLEEDGSTRSLIGIGYDKENGSISMDLFWKHFELRKSIRV